jgi:hypothetical protein
LTLLEEFAAIPASKEEIAKAGWEDLELKLVDE